MTTTLLEEVCKDSSDLLDNRNNSFYRVFFQISPSYGIEVAEDIKNVLREIISPYDSDYKFISMNFKSRTSDFSYVDFHNNPVDLLRTFKETIYLTNVRVARLSKQSKRGRTNEDRFNPNNSVIGTFNDISLISSFF